MGADPKTIDRLAKPDGSFSKCRDELVDQFSEAEMESDTSWRELFGIERRKIAKKGEPFIARGSRRSSSDS